MIHKLIIILILSIYISISNFVVYEKKKETNTENLFFLNPIVLKFFSGEYSTLLANKLWLLSSQIDEMKIVSSNDKEESILQMRKGFDTLNTLDPNFSSPIIYASSYFLNKDKTRENYDIGMKMLNDALSKAPNNTKLLYIKFVYLTTFKEFKPDIEEVIDLAEKLYKKNMIYSGHLKINDFIAETVEYLSTDKVSKKENLLRLSKYAKDETIKKDIEEILKKYDKKENKNDK